MKPLEQGAVTHWALNHGPPQVAQPGDGAEQFLALGSLDLDMFNSQSILCDRHGRK